MRWLCLHFPWLALELHDLPSETPQALLDCRQRIQICNSSAAKQGVREGQALITALALSPELVLLETSERRLRMALEQLALWAGRFSARISLCPPRTLMLEIAGMLHYFGGLDSLLDHLARALEGNGYSTELAVGETARGTQLLVAVESYRHTDTERWWSRLLALGVDQLQLSPEQVEQLQGVGMRTLGDLRRLPRSELAGRFGPALLSDLDRIVDPGAALPAAFVPPEHFSQRCELDAEISHNQGLLFPLRRLLASLEGYLVQRQQEVSRLRLQLKLRDGSVQSVGIGHGGGCVSAPQWLELCRLRLEREKLRGPVLALELIAEEGRRHEPVNGDLFTAAHKRNAVDELIGRLCSRLGSDAVQPLCCQADHRPEAVLRRGRPGRESPPLAQARPGWLLEKPQPLAAVQRRRLEMLSGPERICSGWWESRVERDYFVARWPDGRCGWLFRDPEGHWFVHGWFG